MITSNLFISNNDPKSEACLRRNLLAALSVVWGSSGSVDLLCSWHSQLIRSDTLGAYRQRIYSTIYRVLFIGPKSNSCIVLPLSPSLSQFLLFVRLDWCDPCLTSCCQVWQPCCWHWKKQKPCCWCRRKKSHVDDPKMKQKPSWWCWNFFNLTQVRSLQLSCQSVRPLVVTWLVWP